MVSSRQISQSATKREGRFSRKWTIGLCPFSRCCILSHSWIGRTVSIFPYQGLSLLVLSANLTLCSWKCERCRLDDRSGNARLTVQHSRNTFLRSIHSSRGPQQHRAEDDEAISLDNNTHVLLGTHHDVRTIRALHGKHIYSHPCHRLKRRTDSWVSYPATAGFSLGVSF